MNNSIVTALKDTCDSYLNNGVSHEMFVSFFLESSLNILRQNHDNIPTSEISRTQENNSNDEQENTVIQEQPNVIGQENEVSQEQPNVIGQDNAISREQPNVIGQENEVSQEQQSVQTNQIQLTIMVTRPENVITNNINI